VEINPLIVTTDGRVVALDCKFVMDDSGIVRQSEIARAGTPEKLTGLEARAKAAGLKYIDLEGDIGVLANGAGLTMTTMDVVRHHGGRPRTFSKSAVSPTPRRSRRSNCCCRTHASRAWSSTSAAPSRAPT